MSDIVAAADTAWPLPAYVRARDFQWWRAGDVHLRSGEVLRDARLVVEETLAAFSNEGV